MEIKKIVVIGAGLMGMGVVQVSLQKGYKVTVVDIKDEFIERGVKGLQKGLNRLEQKGRLGDGITAASVLEGMSTTTDLAAAVKDADLVLEAVIENMKIKQDVFKTCADNAPAHCILATNTSSMSISEIASASGKADKCVGVHFFNPVPLMRLVEVIKGDKTSDETMDVVAAWAEDLPCRGKRYVPRVLKDRPGFLANRMIAPAFVLMNWAFDEAVTQGVSWEALEADTLKETSPMGYLELGDYVGHDTYYHINKYYAKTLSPDFTPGKTYTEMVEAKKLGRKVGHGFFDWTQGRPKIDRATKAGIITAEQLDAIEANEGCRLLEEGVVKNWQVIDDTMMAGFNRPGVMELATQNFEKWSVLLVELAGKIGKDYIKPCEFLKTGKFVAMK